MGTLYLKRCPSSRADAGPKIQVTVSDRSKLRKADVCDSEKSK